MLRVLQVLQAGSCGDFTVIEVNTHTQRITIQIGGGGICKAGICEQRCSCFDATTRRVPCHCMLALRLGDVVIRFLLLGSIALTAF